jgi:hypothetical protein
MWQLLLYYIVVGFVMNLTAVLMIAQDYDVRVDILQFIIVVVLWPISLYKLIKGAFEK